MKRLLLALLAILTGLAASGTPVLAAVETQSSATAGVPLDGGRLECRVTRAVCVILRATPSLHDRDIDPDHAAPAGRATPTVHLQADRARE